MYARLKPLPLMVLSFYVMYGYTYSHSVAVSNLIDGKERRKKTLIITNDESQNNCHILARIFIRYLHQDRIRLDYLQRC